MVHERWTRWAGAAAGVALVACLLPMPATAQSPARSRSPVRFGVCDREAPKLLGQKAMHVGGKVRAPRKLHDAKPLWPSDTKLRVFSGVWVGEALIEADGHVHHVWTVRELKVRPPDAKFNEVFLTAIKQWAFEPTRVQGEAVPVCMVVTANINLQ